ncbi:MAG: kelch repeat-containing protein, partial [Acidimicrobiales bacterium]
MAYDSATGQTVLFGGLDANGATLADTWTYNGTTWTKQYPATSPPARAYASMAYDAAIGQMVLFGGLDASGNTLGDTWTYN